VQAHPFIQLKIVTGDVIESVESIIVSGN